VHKEDWDGRSGEGGCPYSEGCKRSFVVKAQIVQLYDAAVQAHAKHQTLKQPHSESTRQCFSLVLAKTWQV